MASGIGGHLLAVTHAHAQSAPTPVPLAADTDEASTPEAISVPKEPAAQRPDPPSEGPTFPLKPPAVAVGQEETELAGFPVIGGSTDIGVQFGSAATITRVGAGYRPYRWKLDALLSASIKGGPDGTEIVQQSHDVRLDIPYAFNGKVRIQPGLFFDKTINSGYFGLGNASLATTDQNGEVGRRYQFRHQELRARVNLRTPITSTVSVAYGLQLRYLNPTSYPESKLDIDSKTTTAEGKPLIYGLQPLDIGIFSGGFIYDTRDDEIFPTKGAYDLVGIRLAGATPTSSDIYWGGFNFVLRRYARIGGPFVLAARVFADFMAGHVPFYDLSQGGSFIAVDLPGGPQGIRGVPNGRYSGLVKVVGNVELRGWLLHFKVLGEKFKIGPDAFVDAGRVWLDYTFNDPRDGKGLGLKYGVGGGIHVLQGTAALFRVEMAYSPDAAAANPGFPIGIYVADSVMF